MRNRKIMSTLDYVKKYELSANDKFNHATFANDLRKDFNKLLTNDIRKNGRITEARFNGAVMSIKDKLNAINNKVNGKIETDKFFNFFFATVIGPKKDSFFKPFK